MVGDENEPSLAEPTTTSVDSLRRRQVCDSCAFYVVYMILRVNICPDACTREKYLEMFTIPRGFASFEKIAQLSDLQDRASRQLRDQARPSSPSMANVTGGIHSF